MARLNVSLPDDLYDLASRWRGSLNLSDVCARALRAELEAAESHRSARALISALAPMSTLERSLADRFGLADAVVSDSRIRAADLREELGRQAAAYLDRSLSDDAALAICGGRQMWCTVRSLSPRNLRLRLTALGVSQSDPQILHAHANTLVTLLWLLYAPRSEAALVGTPEMGTSWNGDLPIADRPRYFVVGSCGPIEPGKGLSRLMGGAATEALIQQRALGDFAYAFVGADGPVDTPTEVPVNTFLNATQLRALAARPDGRVVMVAGGPEKLELMQAVLKYRLCNVLVTDSESAESLLGDSKESEVTQ